MFFLGTYMKSDPRKFWPISSLLVFCFSSLLLSGFLLNLCPHDSPPLNSSHWRKWSCMHACKKPVIPDKIQSQCYRTWSVLEHTAGIFQHCSISMQWYYYQMTNRCWKNSSFNKRRISTAAFIPRVNYLPYFITLSLFIWTIALNAARCLWNLGRPTTRGSPWLPFPIRAAQHPAQGLSKVPAGSRCWLNYQSTQLILHLVWILKHSCKVCRPNRITNSSYHFLHQKKPRWILQSAELSKLFHYVLDFW